MRQFQSSNRFRSPCLNGKGLQKETTIWDRGMREWKRTEHELVSREIILDIEIVHFDGSTSSGSLLLSITRFSGE